MVTVNDATLQDADADHSSANQVNGGTAVALNCTGIELTHNNHNNVPQLPAKDTNNIAHSATLAKGEFLGYANPTLRVDGVIDLNAYDTTTGAAPDDIINLKLLQQFAKAGHKLTLSDVFDSAPTNSIYRISGLTGTYPDETVTTLKVMVVNFKINSNPRDAKEGHILKYTLSLVEVQ